MKNVINQLRTLLPCEQFVVTGSYALSKYGLSTKVGDLDIIIVNPSEEAVNIVTRLAADFPAPTKSNYPTQMLIFMMNGIKVDVFIQKEKEPTEITIDGVQFLTVAGIVKAKKNQNRVKDWIQLREMAGKICKDKEFTEFLDKQ